MRLIISYLFFIAVLSQNLLAMDKAADLKEAHTNKSKTHKKSRHHKKSTTSKSSTSNIPETNIKHKHHKKSSYNTRTHKKHSHHTDKKLEITSIYATNSLPEEKKTDKVENEFFLGFNRFNNLFNANRYSSDNQS